MTSDISERISRVQDQMTKGQKRIAACVLEEYHKCAYMTASELSQSVGVSEATVVRFAQFLGYRGYSEFQRAVQEMVRIRLTPNQRIEVTKNLIAEGDIVHSVMEADMEKIRYTMDRLDRGVFLAAADLIADASHVFVIGARTCEALATLFAHNLSLVRDGVRQVRPSSADELFEQLFSIKSGDVLIAFSFPRYSSKMTDAVRYAKDAGAQIVVITDSDACPLAEHASFLLPAQSDMASFADSLVAPLSIVNCLTVRIADRLGDKITARFDKLEKIWDEYHVYAKK